MAKYRITGPDGATYEITAPDDATEDDVLAYAQQNYKTTAPKADFSDVRTGSNSHEPVTNSMSVGERIAAGAGKSVVDAYQGTKQAATEALGRQTGILARGAHALGFESASDAIAQHVGVPLQESIERQRAEQADRRQIDAALMDTGAGKVGYAAGTIAQLVGPGIAARGTAAASLALPKTIAGNAAQGAAFGYIQPVTQDGERAVNTALGAGAGALGAAIPKVAGGLYRGARDTVRTAGLTSAEKQAASMIQSEAANPEALLRANPSAIPGVNRTLFEETLDPGVARLETRARGRGLGFKEMDTANNAARVDAIRRFAGDESTLAEAMQQRDDATGGLLQQALAPKVPAQTNALRTSLGMKPEGGVNTGPVKSAIAELIAKNSGRSAVQSSLREVGKSLDDAGRSVGGVYNVRKTIDDLLEGKAGSDKAFAKSATRELMQVKELLDQQMTEASPEFDSYLKAYVSGSKPVNQMQLGQYVLRKGSGNQMDEAGRYALQPGRFGALMKDLDGTAQKATKFSKAKAGTILEPDAVATLQAVNDDLNRSALRLPLGSGPGSHTESMQALSRRIGLRKMAQYIPKVGAAIEFLESANAKRLEEVMEQLIANPAEYRRIASRLPAKDRKLIEQALVRLGGAGGASAPALTE